MCGRYALYADEGLVKAVFEISEMPPYKASYNIAPSQSILAVTADQCRRHADLYRWGLIPFWAKEIGRYSTINARAETVASKPVYRAPFKKGRCLIPANGYYEWQVRSGKPKQPYYIYHKDDGLIAFAGVWDRWEPSDDEAVNSASIIVTSSNSDTRTSHDRMPVILLPESWNVWLDPDIHNPEAIQELLTSTPEGILTSRPVSHLVNSPKNNSPDLLI